MAHNGDHAGGMGGPVRALVFTAPGQVELLDVPEPDPAPGEVLVEVRAAGICGSGVTTAGRDHVLRHCRGFKSA